jgi:hypothetical protein
MLFIITFFALFRLLTTSDYPPLVSSNFSFVFYDLWKVIAFEKNNTVGSSKSNGKLQREAKSILTHIYTNAPFADLVWG